MSYNRSLPTRYTVSSTWKGDYFNGERWINNPSKTGSYLHNVLYSNTRSGEKVLDYQQKIRDNQQAGSPYTLEAQKIEKLRTANISSKYSQHVSGKGLFSHQRGEQSGIYGFSVPTGTIPHLSTSLADAEATALQKTYSKIRSEQQELNSAATVAEFTDVIRQFGKPFDAIVDLTNRRLNKLQLAAKGLSGSTSFRKIKFAEIVASTYLEYAFGLAPLISDAEKVATALAKFNNERSSEVLSKFRSRIRSRGVSKTVTKGTNTFGVGFDSYSAMKVTEENQTECRVQYVVGLDTTPIADFGSNDRLLQLLGFDPKNWIPAVWEVVPWSWLIDYFTNVGAILDAAATTTSGVRWIVKTVTYKTVRTYTAMLDVEATRRAINGTNVRLSSLSGGPCSLKVVRTTLTRSLPATLGVPPLVVEHPFDSMKKIANMAAVLVSRKPSSSALWLT